MAWNATISGHLINFFPFTGTTPLYHTPPPPNTQYQPPSPSPRLLLLCVRAATIMQDRATARTRLGRS
jgi:hypothetical protein